MNDHNFYQPPQSPQSSHEPTNSPDLAPGNFTSLTEGPLPATQPARRSRGILRVLSRYIILWLGFFLIVKFVVPSYEVKGSSMVPTYHASGDRVLTDQVFFKVLGGPTRTDIVILSRPTATNNEDELIKRIIGLPGEKVEIQRGVVYINDQPLAEPYIKNKADYTYPPTTLGKDCYFVLGDNRPVSYDSHYFGCVTRDHISAHVLLTYPWHF